MAAVSAALGCLLRAGDEIVAHDLLYGCTHSLFEKWYPRQNITVKRADFRDPAAVARAIGPRTRVLYCETPVNPTLDMVDLRALAKVRDDANRRRGADDRMHLAVDSTFATPFCSRPIEHGADIVIHSLTKNIGGFGTEVGGAVVCPERLYKDLKWYRKDFGGVLNAKTAWSILVYGLPTLPVRLKRQQYTAMRVAQHLKRRADVASIRYPGLPDFPQKELARRQMVDFDGEFAPGNMIYFEVDRSKVDPIALVNDVAANAYSITLAVSLGHVKTLIEMPSAMTHSAYSGAGAMKGVNGIRLSIGLESPVDIIRDLDAAFERAAVGKTAKRAKAAA
jgi:cystathionine beta-lyase/cystathionine gamma-synthase